MNSAAICLNTVKYLLPIPLAKRMKNRLPQGSMIPQYLTLKNLLEKKFNTVNPHVLPPSKIIMSEIFNLYELSNYMKKKRPK